MKVYNDDLPDISDLFQAYFDCRSGKRNSDQALEYELDFESRIFDLYERLVNKTYTPNRSIFFVLTDVKAREVWASEFEDRIVHHLLYNQLFDRFVNAFIHDLYSCIPGRGTHRAVDRLEHFGRSATENYSDKCYYLQCDVKSFYMNINKDIVYKLVSKKLQHPWWLWLVETVLYSDPRGNYICNSPKWKLDKIPLHKSLFNKAWNIGLAIGNLSSQFFANIILNELDQFAKHVLKTRYYIRYADDIVILSRDPQYLNHVYDRMNEFLKTQLHLEFHPSKKILQPTERGINFVGYIVKHHRRYIRGSTIRNFINKEYDSIENPMSTVNSYFGFFKHCNCHNVKRNASETFLKDFKFDCDLIKTLGRKS